MIFNTSIFFVSVLFLICAAITAAERGSSLQRRRTSIGNRPSVAPVMPGDDDDDDDNGDDDYENGKGGGKGDGKGDGKGNGYNSGISKSSKKSKSKKFVEYGKGMYMSMPMEEGKGDGKGDGKGVKSEKSYKSYDSKKSKNDKGYYYYGHGKVLLYSTCKYSSLLNKYFTNVSYRTFNIHCREKQFASFAAISRTSRNKFSYFGGLYSCEIVSVCYYLFTIFLHTSKY